MAILWIGDFRLGQLQQYQIKTKNIGTDSVFLLDDNADFTWVNELVNNQLPQMAIDNADVIIMSGFNDCVYSCAWKMFDIDRLAANYISTVNKLVEQYKNINFYFCSVNPVDADYPFVGYTNTGLIPAKTLNKKIQLFNTKVKELCKATFIDSYSYFTNTGFDTRDGIRFTLETCGILHNFIINQLSFASASSFMSTVRATLADAPSAGVEYKDSNYLHWTATSVSGGLNACAAHKKATDGTVLPNNVGYAWGRFMEILGETPTLPTTNKVADWWSSPTHTYSKGTEPQLGSIICWETSGGNIHLAIVEYIDKKTNSILVSKSYNKDAEYDPTNPDHFNVLTLARSEAGTWGESSTLTFLGFIYCSLSVSMSLNKKELCTKNSYDISIEEMKPNAQYIWQHLSQQGWTMNAVAALLGNIQAESNMSPCVWEGTIQGSIINSTTGEHTLNSKVLADFEGGYGLTQWTPYTKYYNWCQDGRKNETGKVLPYWEMDSQLKRIDWEARYNKQWSLASYNYGWKYKDEAFDNLTFEAFRISTKDPDWLAAAFAYCYERSWFTDWVDSDDSKGLSVAEERLAVCTERGGYATYWYNYLKSLAPVSFTVGVSASNYFKLTNLKIDKCLPTRADVSFFAPGAKSCTYEFKRNSDSPKTDTFTVSSDVETFSLEDLIPNSKYTLTVAVQDADKQSRSKSISFITPQDYPAAVKNIQLSCKDNIKSVNSRFELTVTKPDSSCYWNKNDCGYYLYLFVNNKCVKTKTIDNINNISESFTIKDKFGYTCKTGDTIQVGIRVWANDNNGIKVYNPIMDRASEAICLLNQSMQIYLNK